jgi:hypothetical protein
MVMDSDDYKGKLRGLLDEKVYRKAKKYPTAAIERSTLKEVRMLEK